MTIGEAKARIIEDIDRIDTILTSWNWSYAKWSKAHFLGLKAAKKEDLKLLEKLDQ